MYSYLLLATLSSARTPTIAIPVKSGFCKYSLKVNIWGAVLNTLQHHLLVVEGGPNFFHASLGIESEAAIKNLIPSDSH